VIEPTILLIDDDADLLQVVGNRCCGLGLNVQRARNLLTATTVMERYVPDIVCVDVELPTGNGLRFCEALAADPRTAHVPIIVLTGRQDAKTIQVCRSLDAHYIFKSADIWATLEPLIRRLISDLPPKRPQTTSGIRPRNLPAHSIPPWPAEAEAGNRNRADAGNKSELDAGNRTVTKADTAQHSAGRQVVVADDDNDVVQLLSERFSSLGCSVISVNTSLDAINAIHRVQPELVVLDVNMPTGSGLCVCEMMATDERLRMVPVIILTGCSDEKTIRRCHDMLVFYVQKGSNIWDRIEPLVRELLHLDDAPSQAALSPAARPTKRIQHSAPTPAAARGEQDSLMDAVFAMLAADADGDGGGGGGGGEAKAGNEIVDVPWVLCIDDDVDFSDALKIRLEEHGVAVAWASNGMEGYRLAFASPASAILLDYSMPNGQGDYILGRLKDNPVTKDIPVFMITGMKDKMLERRVTSMGAAGYFHKPVDFHALRARLSNYIDILAESAPRLTAARE